MVTTDGTFGGNVDPEDNYRGSCTADMTVGPDAVFAFTAPEAGEWEFNTTGSEFDTVMYARESCLDPTTELDCNDDIDFGAGLSQSRLRLNLVADQTVYVFIDTYNDETLTAGAFTLLQSHS